MSYADALLSTGERVIRRARQHWFILVWGARYPVLALIGAIALLILRANMSPDAAEGAGGTLLGWIFAALFIGGVAFLAWGILRYRNQEYVLTNRRVIQVEGVINKLATDSSLEKINDAELKQTLAGRIFGFGDLDVLTAADAGVDRFRMIRDPIAFKRAMLDAKHEYEQDMARAERAGPPLRAGRPAGDVAGRAVAPATATEPSSAPAAEAVPSARPPAPGASIRDGGGSVRQPDPATAGQGSAAPAGPASRTMTPDEVTRTLASLADLRDRGAITEQEYELKKRDLLARL